jgi:hypothetical protein
MEVDATILFHPALAELICEYLYAEEDLIFSSLSYGAYFEQREHRLETLSLFQALFESQAAAAYDRAIEREVSDLIRTQIAGYDTDDSD